MAANMHAHLPRRPVLHLLHSVCMAVWLGSLAAAAAAAHVASARDPYIFATFDGDGGTEQELWIYTSLDGLDWAPLADTNFTGPTGTLRDPSIIRHTDGRYYVAYTVRSWSAQSTHFNIASSADLVNWTHVASVDAGVPGTAYTWAPEFFVDDDGMVHVIASLSPPQPFSFRLDVAGASLSDGATVIQWTCTADANQQWQMVRTGSHFNLKARHSGKCLNVVGSSLSDAALLEQRACGAGASFQWTRQ